MLLLRLRHGVVVVINLNGIVIVVVIRLLEVEQERIPLFKYQHLLLQQPILVVG